MCRGAGQEVTGAPALRFIFERRKVQVTIDYSHCNQAFVDGLWAFLEYTEPNSLRTQPKEGLMVRRCLQKGDFEKRCIQRWAISELADSIIKNPYEPVEDTTYKRSMIFSSLRVIASCSCGGIFRCPVKQQQSGYRSISSETPSKASESLPPARKHRLSSQSLCSKPWKIKLFDFVRSKNVKTHFTRILAMIFNHIFL